MIAIDMQMPESCVECRFNISEFGYCNAMPVEFVGHVNDCEEDGRPEWCPLKNCNIQEYDDALRLMVYQYCTEEHGDEDEFFNAYMSAGESAFKVLGIKNGQEVPEGWV